jgi:predicted glycoside hydrolase/deacetylase ChbG (UPF0249 family)
MPARLIVNADDFGLTAGINRAVAELQLAGVLSSATLMANGAAFEDAIQVARANPGLGVGCHVVLTDGVPVSDPAAIPTLIEPGTALLRPKLGDFLRALLSGRIREEDIATEALAQVQKIQRAGIALTHLDTHKHTHLFPAVLRPLLRVAEQTAIPAIRSPFEPTWAAGLPHGPRLRRTIVGLTALLRPKFKRLLRSTSLATTDGTLAISATGDLTATTLSDILRALPATGTYELCCHPGYNDRDLEGVSTRLRAQREIEHGALLTEGAKFLNQPNGPELIHYGDFSPRSPAYTAKAFA